jgi:hypothetical protein
LGSFKRDPYKTSYVILLERLTNLRVGTFYGDLCVLTKNLKDEELKGSILELIENILKFKPNFGRSDVLSKIKTETLAKCLISAKNNYVDANSIISSTNNTILNQNNSPLEQNHSQSEQNNLPSEQNNEQRNSSTNDSTQQEIQAFSLNQNQINSIARFGLVSRISQNSNPSNEPPELRDSNYFFLKIRISYRRALIKENNVRILESQMVPLLLNLIQVIGRWPVYRMILYKLTLITKQFLSSLLK